MLWVKAFHIIFMVTWFAGLFYLPRLFVYHVETADAAAHERFCVMERRLSVIMSIGAALTIAFGLWLLWLHGLAWLGASAWMHAKLAMVAALIGFHGWCQLQVRKLRQGGSGASGRTYRLMNEVPALLLVVIVVLAVVKPF